MGDRGLAIGVRRMTRDLLGSHPVLGQDGKIWPATFRNSFGLNVEGGEKATNDEYSHHLDIGGVCFAVGKRFTFGCHAVQWHPELSYGTRSLAALLDEAVQGLEGSAFSVDLVISHCNWWSLGFQSWASIQGDSFASAKAALCPQFFWSLQMFLMLC